MDVVQPAAPAEAAKVRNCANFSECGQSASSKRAKFCSDCFRRRAKRVGGHSRGNHKARGSQGNRGNTSTTRKSDAGIRSGLKRSARFALTVKKQWLDMILSGAKTWEIRGTNTDKRGWIHLAQSKSGKLMGRARLVNALKINRDEFDSYFHFHQIPDASDVNYKIIYAWVVEDAQKFEEPLHYHHTQGAVRWVRL